MSSKSDQGVIISLLLGYFRMLFMQHSAEV